MHRQLEQPIAALPVALGDEIAASAFRMSASASRPSPGPKTEMPMLPLNVT
jgi:hypothetical protein